MSRKLKVWKLFSIILLQFQLVIVLIFPVIVSNPLDKLAEAQPNIVWRVAPSVVKIKTTKGVGSGFIIRPDGYILTARHVIEDEYGYLVRDISVYLNGKRYWAEVIKTDHKRDLALLKIEAEHLRAVELGDSSRMEILDYVIVLGYPFGAFTVTDGKISAIRKINGVNVLQTTAPINPGNSGGAVVNSEGKVVGIVSARITPAQNFNFAIAINEISSLFPTIQEMVEAADPGDVIKIGAGIYRPSTSEDLVIRKSLTLKGSGIDKVILESPIQIESRNPIKVLIEGVTITRGGGISIGGKAKVTIKNSLITNIIDDGGAVRAGGSSQLTIKNSKIEVHRGVYIFGKSNATIDGNQITGNIPPGGTYGIKSNGGRKIKILNNELINHGSSIFLNETEYVLIQGNIIRAPMCYPITLNRVSQARIIDNQIPSETDWGIEITNLFFGYEDSEYVQAIIKNNELLGSIQVEGKVNATILQNEAWSIDVYRGAKADIRKNNDEVMITVADMGTEADIKENSAEFIYITDKAYGVITKNKIVGSTVDGVKINEEAQAIIEGNEITRNDEYGIRLEKGTEATIQRNEISHNGDGGIYVDRDAKSTIRKSIISNNGHDKSSRQWPANGITIKEGAEATIEDNQITGNQDWGVSIYLLCELNEPIDFKGLIRGRGNVIEGNKKGAVCPIDLKFLIGEEGGEYPSENRT